MDTISVIEERTLLSLAAEKNVCCIKVVEFPQDAPAIEVAISLEEFIDMARRKGKDILYSYEFMNESDAKITDITLMDATPNQIAIMNMLGISDTFGIKMDMFCSPEDYDYEEVKPEFNPMEKRLFERIEEYNSTIDNDILDKPYFVRLAIIEGSYILYTSDGASIPPIDNSLDILSMILGEFNDELEAAREEKQKEKVKLRVSLENRILEDRNFIIASNNILRRSYARTIAQDIEYRDILLDLYPSRYSASGIDETRFAETLETLYINNKDYLAEARKELKKSEQK